MNLSFFIHNGGSGKIRGEQIAQYLGAKLNPTNGFENDICIYVKSAPPENYPKHTYIDVVEDSEGLRWVYSHPEVGVIASSQTIYDYLKAKLKNRIVLIPQNSVNYNREVRTRTKVEVAGIHGNKASFQYPLDDLEKKLNEIGIQLKTFIKKSFTNGRQEIIDYYKTIDIQLVWRPQSDGILRNPLKLINACSFGIPTIAYPEQDFVAEFEGCFFQVQSIEEMIATIRAFKNNEDFYCSYSQAGLEIAEEYHISNIAKLYQKLT